MILFSENPARILQLRGKGTGKLETFEVGRSSKVRNWFQIDLDTLLI